MPVLSSFSQLPASAVSAAGAVVSSSTPSSATATVPKPKTLVRRPTRDKTAAAVPAAVPAPAPTKPKTLVRRPARDKTAAAVPVPVPAPAPAPAAAKPRKLIRRPARDKTAAPTPAPTPAPAPVAASTPAATVQALTPASSPSPTKFPHPTRAPTASDDGKAAPQAVLTAARWDLDERLRDRPPCQDCLCRNAINNNIACSLPAARSHNAAPEERLRTQDEVQALRDELAAERCRSAALQDELMALKTAMAAAASSNTAEPATTAIAKTP
ncbi:hypothetical protein IWQ56_006625, partial [Coemansia nantahalensis]